MGKQVTIPLTYRPAQGAGGKRGKCPGARAPGGSADWYFFTVKNN